MKKNGNGGNGKHIDRLSNEDRLEWQLGIERLARIKAQVATLQSELHASERAHNEVVLRLKAAYSITNRDTIDTNTGKITRNGLRVAPEAVSTNKPEAAPQA